jgi:hypothetical protein
MADRLRGADFERGRLLVRYPHKERATIARPLHPGRFQIGRPWIGSPRCRQNAQCEHDRDDEHAKAGTIAPPCCQNGGHRKRAEHRLEMSAQKGFSRTSDDGGSLFDSK